MIAEGADELAAAAARVLLDEPLAAALVRDGRALVEQRFSPEVVGRQLRGLAAALEPPCSGDEAGRDEL